MYLVVTLILAKEVTWDTNMEIGINTAKASQ